MRGAKRIAFMSVLTAAALIVFIIEAQIPPIVPVPGVKLGLANIVTVYCVFRFTASETALVVSARLLLGAAALSREAADTLLAGETDLGA